MIAVPALATVPTHTLNAFVQLQLPPGSAWRIVGGGSGIAPTRNMLIQHFLEHRARFDSLLFLDSDMVPPPDTIWRLAAHRRPVVAAFAVRRVGPPLACCGPEGGVQAVLPRKPFPVAWTGLGCCLIARRVLEQIAPPWCVDNARGLGEDAHFSAQIRAAGFEILVDPTITVGHVAEPQVLGIEDAVRAGTVRWAE